MEKGTRDGRRPMRIIEDPSIDGILPRSGFVQQCAPPALLRRRVSLNVRLHKGTSVLHPNQFKVNEAWIAFELNDEPIHTEHDGDFNFLALMDAASCFILSSVPVAAKQAEPTQLESKRLLNDGQAHKKRWPKTLFVPTEQPAQCLLVEAERVGIEVVRVAEEQLLPFIGEAREGFRERFGSRGAQ